MTARLWRIGLPDITCHTCPDDGRTQDVSRLRERLGRKPKNKASQLLGSELRRSFEVGIILEHPITGVRQILWSLRINRRPSRLSGVDGFPEPANVRHRFIGAQEIDSWNEQSPQRGSLPSAGTRFSETWPRVDRRITQVEIRHPPTDGSHVVCNLDSAETNRGVLPDPRNKPSWFNLRTA